jgi:hypothetical protein
MTSMEPSPARPDTEGDVMGGARAGPASGWTEWNAIFNLALVAACLGRGVIIVPGMIVIGALTVPGHG